MLITVYLLNLDNKLSQVDSIISIKKYSSKQERIGGNFL